MQQFHQIAADPKEAGPFRTQEPLVAVSGQKVDRRLLHIEGQHAEALDGIDAEIHLALATKLAEGIH